MSAILRNYAYVRRVLIFDFTIDCWLWNATFRHYNFLSERKGFLTAVLVFLSLHKKESLNISYDVIEILKLLLGLNENCCFGCRLWLLGQFQRLVCELPLKGLVPSHFAKSFDFSRWGIINIWINFDSHYKGLWTWSSSSN